MKRTGVLAASAIVLVAVAVAVGVAIGLRLPSERQASPDKNEFSFQVDGYTSKNRGGQSSNLYFSYRYNDGLADSDIPDYRKIRTAALAYLDGIDPGENLFLEQINKAMCTELAGDFPLEAISCQTQVLPDEPGVNPETGLRGSTYSSTYTIGDIASLDVPGPLFGVPTGRP